MDDKDFKDCMDKLTEVADRLDATTERMGKIIDKTLDYCIIVNLIMFIIFITVILF